MSRALSLTSVFIVIASSSVVVACSAAGDGSSTAGAVSSTADALHRGSRHAGKDPGAKGSTPMPLPAPGACAHSVCTVGVALEANCTGEDGEGLVAEFVCGTDLSPVSQFGNFGGVGDYECCEAAISGRSWAAQCVTEAESVLALSGGNCSSGIGPGPTPSTEDAEFAAHEKTPARRRSTPASARSRWSPAETVAPARRFAKTASATPTCAATRTRSPEPARIRSARWARRSSTAATTTASRLPSATTTARSTIRRAATTPRWARGTRSAWPKPNRSLPRAARRAPIGTRRDRGSRRRGLRSSLRCPRTAETHNL